MDSEAMEERDVGRQKDVNEHGGSLGEEKEEGLLSPPQSKETEDGLQSEDVYAPPLDQASEISPPFHEHDKSAPIQDEAKQGGLVKSEVDADDAAVSIEPKVEGLDDMGQGEAPVENEQEPDVRALTEIEREPDIEAPMDALPNASGPLKTESEREDPGAIQLDQPLDEFEPDQQAADALESSASRSDLHVGDVDASFITFAPKDGGPSLGKLDTSVSEEGNIEEPQEQLVDNLTELSYPTEEPQGQLADGVAGPFCTREDSQEQLVDAAVGGHVVDEELSLEEARESPNDGQEAVELADTDTVVYEVNPAVSEQRIQDDSAEPPISEEHNEQVDLETSTDTDTVVYEVNPAVSEERIQDDSAEPPVSEEHNEQVNLETSIAVLDELPSAPGSDKALLIKEPSLSTPAMEALIDADSKEPLYEQESSEILEDSEKTLVAEKANNESAGGDGQGSVDGISSQLEQEANNNEPERSENSSFKQELDTDQCRIHEKLHAEQDLDIAPPATEQEPLEQSLDTASSSSELEVAAETRELRDEAGPLVAEEDNVNEEELGLEAPLIKQAIDVEGGVTTTAAVVDEDASANNLDKTITVNEPGGEALNSEQGFYSSDKKETLLLEASDSHGFCQNRQLDTEGLSAEQDKFSVQINDEVDLASAPERETGLSEAEVKIEASNGQLDEDDPNNRVQDDQGSVNMIPCGYKLMEANHIDENCDRSSSLSEPLNETEQDEQNIGSALTPSDNPNDVMESVMSEAPNKISLSERVLDNGDSLRRFPSTDNEEKVEGSCVVPSTEPVLEFGTVRDGASELEASITTSLENGPLYHRTSAEDDVQITPEPLTYNNSNRKDELNQVNETGTQAVKTEDGGLNAGEGKEVVGGAMGIAADKDATGISNPLLLENGSLEHSEGDIEKASMGKEYINGMASASMADKATENAGAPHYERIREASLSLMNQRVSEHARQKAEERINGTVTLVQRTNWWGCCGMLDVLLHKD